MVTVDKSFECQNEEEVNIGEPGWKLQEPWWERMRA